MAVVDERRRERFSEIMSHYVPPQAVGDIVGYINNYSIYLKITRERNTKFGDYRLPSHQNPGHCISVNGNLPPEGFLLVLLHELAHMLTFIDCGRRVKPHGAEWQRHYSSLILSFVAKGCFSADVASLLQTYASSLPLDKKLERQIDSQLKILPSAIADADEIVTLDTLPAGSRFRIKGNSNHTFESIERLRTRWKCRDIATGRLYTVSSNAPVDPV